MRATSQGATFINRTKENTDTGAKFVVMLVHASEKTGSKEASLCEESEEEGREIAFALPEAGRK